MVNVRQRYYDAYWGDKTFSYKISITKRALFAQYCTPSARVLDVGCGNGEHYGKALAKRCRRYVGLDISKRAVANARRQGIDARVADFEKTFPLPSGSFDVVICIENLEHLFAPGSTVREIHRVLRKGGVALISVPNAAWWVDRVLLGIFGRVNPRGRDAGSRKGVWEDPHIRFFTKRSLAAMLSRAGFRVERVMGEPACLWPSLLSPHLLAICRKA